MEIPETEPREKEYPMKRTILACVFFAAAAAVGAQEPNPYQGTSNPPPDDQILTSGTPDAKPSAGHRAQPPAPAPAESQSLSQPSASEPAVNPPDSSLYQGDDGGIVHPASDQPATAAMPEHASAYDPDGDIVHPRPPRPGELVEGTSIRVRLMQRLSTVTSRQGEAFRTRVASDVVEGGQVVIPAGAEIDGRVMQVTTGHAGGHGSMRLQPETVILSNGSRFMLHAQTTGAPGSRTRIGSEGSIAPGSRLKRDGIEYGGAVGAGAVTGAILAGPAGAVTGGLIGAGAVTVHLLVSHPQATLESGTTMTFTLTEPLDMVPASSSGS
jgi:hypothetical protein